VDCETPRIDIRAPRWFLSALKKHFVGLTTIARKPPKQVAALGLQVIHVFRGGPVDGSHNAASPSPHGTIATSELPRLRRYPSGVGLEIESLAGGRLESQSLVSCPGIEYVHPIHRPVARRPLGLRGFGLQGRGNRRVITRTIAVMTDVGLIICRSPPALRAEKSAISGGPRWQYAYEPTFRGGCGARAVRSADANRAGATDMISPKWSAQRPVKGSDPAQPTMDSRA